MLNCMFPVEIMMMILSHLPIKSLVRFRCVCNSWFRLLTAQDSNPYFTQLHAHRTSIANPNSFLIHLTQLNSPENNEFIDSFYFASCHTQFNRSDALNAPFGDQQVQVLGVCNGLVCIVRRYTKVGNIYIWNPITRDYITIPRPPYLSEDRIKKTIYGFGFCHATNEYKVIGTVLSDSENYYHCQAYVYILGANTWRTLQDLPFNLSWQQDGACVNGSLHWLAREPKVSYTLKLISFDLENEISKEIVTPKAVFSWQWYGQEYRMDVKELGGLLAIFHLIDYQNEIHIWLMKDYGVEDSWIKQFTFRLSEMPYSRLKPMGVADDGHIMMQDQNLLMLFNPNTKSSTSIEIFRSPVNLCIYIYKWSFVSPRYIRNKK